MTAGEELFLRLVVASHDAELEADRLWQAGATAVGIEETGGGIGEADGGGTTVLTASFPTAAATHLVATEVGGEVVAADPSWRDAWRQHAVPVEVGARLVVAPAWRDVALGDEGRMVLRIDPGGCFGSGTHPSTRLVLATLDSAPPDGLRVVDVGCGSGILAVAAARLGAAWVSAVDIDSEAIEVTRINAAANGVGDLVDVSKTPVEDLHGPFDLALVNVTAGVHAVLGPSVSSVVTKGGRLILAGLLPGQWRHVAGAYPGTTLVEELALEGWEGALLELAV